MGGGSGELTFWWQVSWDDLDTEIYNRINLPIKHKDKLHINELELAAIVVNFYATLKALENRHLEFNWQPLLHCGRDSRSTNSWYKRFSKSNKFSVGQTKLVAIGQKILGLDMKLFHDPEKLNGFVDAVSLGVLSLALDNHLKKDYPTNKSTLACLQVDQLVKKVALQRFLLSQLLLSHISCILLGQNTQHLQSLCKRNLGQIILQIITFDFAISLWKWTLS